MRNIDIPPVWLFVFLFLLWGTMQINPAPPAFQPNYQRAALLFVAIGIGLMIWTVAVMMQARTTAHPHGAPMALVTQGPFAFSRNPIYLGDMLVLIGASLWWQAWTSMILVPLFGVLLVRRFIEPEEARLEAAFGEQFVAYKSRVRRWI